MFGRTKYPSFRLIAFEFHCKINSQQLKSVWVPASVVSLVLNSKLKMLGKRELFCVCVCACVCVCVHACVRGLFEGVVYCARSRGLGARMPRSKKRALPDPPSSCGPSHPEKKQTSAHVCAHCGKDFARASALTKHVRTHTGENLVVHVGSRLSRKSRVNCQWASSSSMRGKLWAS